MQTSSLSKALYAPFLIGAVICLYLSWEYTTEYAIYAVPCVVGFAVVNALSPQIDWWWWKRFPPKLSVPLVELLNRQVSFFRELTPSDKTRFANRVALYLRGVEFKPQAMEAVPADIQTVLAAAAVQVTFGREDFLLQPFENIIVYPHPFPSPQFPENWHSSELYEPDGVLIFSMEHIGHSFAKPQQYFHSPFYEYIRAYQLKYKDEAYPEWGSEKKVVLSTGEILEMEPIRKWIGLPAESVNWSALGMALCFQFPDAMRAQHQDVFVQSMKSLKLR